MDGWKRWFVFLPLCVCADNRAAVTVVKTAGRGADITPVCADGNFSIVLWVMCTISTDAHRGDGCHLMYVKGKRFHSQCDSRFALMNANRTVFIQLSGLTPKDSGNYSCDCSYEGWKQAVHLRVTVEDEEKNMVSTMKLVAAVIIAAVAVAAAVISAVISGTICGLMLRRSHHSRQSTSAGCELSRFETVQTLEQDDNYTSLQQISSDVYQTICSRRHDAGTSPASTQMTEYLTDQEPDAGESEPPPIYETLSN